MAENGKGSDPKAPEVIVSINKEKSGEFSDRATGAMIFETVDTLPPPPPLPQKPPDKK